MKLTTSFLGRLSRVLLLVPVVACSDPRTAGAPPSTPTVGSVPPGATPVGAAIALGTTPLAVSERGVPRLLQATQPAIAPAATLSDSARIHVVRLAPAWGVKAMPVLESLGEVRVGPNVIVRMRQVIDGLPVAGHELRVLVRPSGELVAIGGELFGHDTPRTAAVFGSDDTAAIAKAIDAQYKAAFDADKLAMRARRADGTLVRTGRSGVVDVSQASARKSWFVGADGTLTASWNVEVMASSTMSGNGDAFRVVMRSSDGTVLAKHSLVDDASFNYRVFAEANADAHPFDGPQDDLSPHPHGTPDGTYPGFTTPNLISVEGLNHPAGQATPDPWLAANATETTGNNVDAYTDANPPDGFNAGTDFRANTTAAGAFDRTYDTAIGALSSQDQQKAGITSLFYLINWLHDFWYDRGFDEKAGNAQASNLGRGGEEGDAINAEAQDNALGANGGSRNNANMSTPSDGLQPRMQVFLWTQEVRKITLQPLNRTLVVGSAAFGPTSFDATAHLLLAQSAGGSTLGCTPLTNDVHGATVLVDRGTCSFKTKALNIQNAGGVGMILANNVLFPQPPQVPPGLGNDPAITTPITINVLSINKPDGDQLKIDLAAGNVNAQLKRTPGPELEGTLDASVIAHEFGHYLHHRLTQCNTLFCGAQSEGWGDFTALLVMARPGDNLDGTYAVGVYSTMSFAGDPGYFGIRRVPYSTQQTVNSLRFHHMSANAAPPATHPFLVIGPNNEVHNAGEVWSSMLWEGYVALQKSGTSFDDQRKKMQEYVVGGLLMAPTDATPIETRDAILVAAHAASPADHDTLINAYATRGFGSCAVSPGKASADFNGIIDGNDVRARTLVGAPAFAVTTKCDNDAVLDHGETMKITLPVSNPGHKDVTDASVRVVSTTPGLFVTSPDVSIAKLEMYKTQMVEATIHLDDRITGPLNGDMIVQVRAAGSCAPLFEVPLQIRLNVDDVTTKATTDTFNTEASVWTPAGLTAWNHIRRNALDGLWRGSDVTAKGETSLVSPALTGSATDPVTLTFQHRHVFEFSTANGGNAFDGGVLEITTDGGTTFVDVQTLVPSLPYNGAITTGSDNDLGGRAAFVNTNPGLANFDTVVLDFGNKLAGKTFQLRWRIATDTGGSAEGWSIDNVAFTGITGTPFPAAVSDESNCDAQPPTPDAGTNVGPDAGDAIPGDSGGCCDAGPLRTGNTVLGLGVVALLLRRRRR